MMECVTFVPEDRYRITTGVIEGCGRKACVIGVIVVIMIIVLKSWSSVSTIEMVVVSSAEEEGETELIRAESRLWL